ncbi:unnamed protein product [Arabidopsis lyrata]|nr:unnamed protein product [Arabidopsis lyrata]
MREATSVSMADHIPGTEMMVVGVFWIPEKERFTKKSLFGLSDNSHYVASSGNWFLMVYSCHDFYIFNLFTGKKNSLPSMKYSIRGGKVRFEPSGDYRLYNWGHFVDHFRRIYVSKDTFGCKRSAVLWIDERTGDYFVAWILNNHDFVSGQHIQRNPPTVKKGDDSWWNWNNKYGTKSLFRDLAYKNGKLYLYTYSECIKIIDFSGDSPKEDIKK